jgi:hypothetical protein
VVAERVAYARMAHPSRIKAKLTALTQQRLRIRGRLALVAIGVTGAPAPDRVRSTRRQFTILPPLPSRPPVACQPAFEPCGAQPPPAPARPVPCQPDFEPCASGRAAVSTNGATPWPTTASGIRWADAWEP